MRDAREIRPLVLQKIDKIIGGGFAFDIGGEGENDFGKIFFLDALEQFLDPQIFRTNVIERRDAAA